MLKCLDRNVLVWKKQKRKVLDLKWFYLNHHSMSIIQRIEGFIAFRNGIFMIFSILRHENAQTRTSVLHFLYRPKDTKLNFISFYVLRNQTKTMEIIPRAIPFSWSLFMLSKKVISRHIINHNKMPQNKYKALAPVPPTKSLKLIGRLPDTETRVINPGLTPSYNNIT